MGDSSGSECSTSNAGASASVWAREKYSSMKAFQMESRQSSKIFFKMQSQEIQDDNQTCDIIAKLAQLHPTGAPGLFEKHYVLVNLYVTKMVNFKCFDETAFIEFSLEMWWRDKSLIGKKGDNFDVTKIWTPEIDVVGTFKAKYVPEGDKGTYWILDDFSPFGIVNYYAKFRATVHVPLNLKQFPFDHQIINLRITSRIWDINNCHFIDFTEREELEDMCFNMEMPEWEIVGPLEIFEEKPYSFEDKRNYSQICFEVQLKRKTGPVVFEPFTASLTSNIGYYKGLIMLVMLVSVMNWAIFFVEPTDLVGRISTAVTLFLAAVALNFVIVEEIPKISHATHVSRYLIVTYIAIMLSIVENVIAFILTESNRTDAAKILDWVFLSIYGSLILIYSMILVFAGVGKPQKLRHKYPPESRKRRSTAE